jgi:hypothetical protein
MSGLFTLLGVVIAVVANIAMKRIDHRNAIALKRIEIGTELEKKYLLEPLVSFMDKELQLMQKLYAHKLQPEGQTDCPGPVSEHYLELSVTEARVRALGDNILVEKFEAFSRTRIGVGTYADEGKSEEALRELKAAIKLAGEMLGLLFRKLRKIEE